jgi:hypothetical protein
MEPMNDKDIAEFIRLFQDLQAPKEEPEQEEDAPFMHSEAWDLAGQLWDFLGKLHAEDLQAHANNKAWLQQIDKTVKELEELIRGTSLVTIVVVCLFLLLTMVILRACGG